MKHQGCLLLILLSIVSCIESLGQCQSFNSIHPFTGSKSVCNTVLPVDYQVFLDNSTCLENIEQSTDVQGFPSFWFPLTPPCANALARYQCQSAYPPCKNSSPILPCSDACNIAASCSSIDMIVLSTAHFDFSQLVCSNDANNCSNIPLPTTLPLPKCATYTGKVCAGVVNYPYYLPPTMTQEFFEAKASSLSRLFAIAPRESDCQKKAAAFYCSQLFMRCDDTVVARNVPDAAGFDFAKLPFPRYPCKSLCYEYNNSCQDLIQQNTSLIPDCDSHGNAPDVQRFCNGSISYVGQDNYPENKTIFNNASGVILSTDCNPFPLTDFVAEAAAFSDCPYPTVQPEDYTKVDQWVIGSCALPCPLPFTSKHDYRVQDIVCTFLKSISFIFIIFMNLTYAIFPSKQKIWVVRNFLFAVFLENMSAISGGLRTSAGGTGSAEFLDLDTYGRSVTYRCLTNTYSPTKADTTICRFQGFMSAFGSTTLSCWWMLIALDLWIRIVAEKKTANSKIQQILFYFYGWGVPLICVNVGLSLSDVRAQGSWACVMSNLDYSTWIGFYGLMLVSLIIGGVLMGWTVIRIVQISLVSKSRPQYIRLAVFLVVFSIELINVVKYRFKLDDWVPKATDAGEEWLECLLRKGATSTAEYAISQCGTSPKFVIQLLGLIVQQASSGIVATLFFLDVGCYRLWKYLILPPNPCLCSKMKDFSSTNPSGSKASQTTKKNLRQSKVKLEKSDLHAVSTVELPVPENDRVGGSVTSTYIGADHHSSPELHPLAHTNSSGTLDPLTDADNSGDASTGGRGDNFGPSNSQDSGGNYGCPSPSRVDQRTFSESNSTSTV